MAGDLRLHREREGIIAPYDERRWPVMVWSDEDQASYAKGFYRIPQEEQYETKEPSRILSGGSTRGSKLRLANESSRGCQLAWLLVYTPRTAGM